MAIISFALTVKEFLSDKQIVTRRDWSDKNFLIWCKKWINGNKLHTAYDKVSYAGGKRIGSFVLTCCPYREKLADMPIEDLVAEGGMCKTLEEYCKFIDKRPEDTVTVIRFRKVSEEKKPLDKTF